MRNFRNSGRRLLCLVLCLICIACTALPAMAAGTDGVPESADSYTSLVHSRARYGSSVIGQLENGTQISVLGQSGGFYKIDCYGRSGYIAGNQVTQEQDGSYYITCDPSSQETRTIRYVSMADALIFRSSILDMAERYLGNRYVYGGSRPGSFDCSGYASYLYRRHGYDLHRCADDQMQDGLIIAREGLQVGDLLFFRASGTPWLASHVGIYAGDNRMIHAATSHGVSYSSLDTPYYANSYVGARRIVNISTQGVEEARTLSDTSSVMSRSIMGIRTVH